MDSSRGKGDNPESCPVCLADFDDTLQRPRTLPCGHTICTLCIDKLKEQGEGLVTCPECRFDHVVPEGGEFPVSYIAEALMRAMRDAKVAAAASVPPRVRKRKAAPRPAAGKKKVARLSKKMCSFLQEQEVTVMDAIAACREVESQLDQYQTTLTDWGEQQQQLEDMLRGLMEQSGSVKKIVDVEKFRVAAKKWEVKKGRQELRGVLETLYAPATNQEAGMAVTEMVRCLGDSEQVVKECQKGFPDASAVTAVRKVRVVSSAALEAAQAVLVALEAATDAETRGHPHPEEARVQSDPEEARVQSDPEEAMAQSDLEEAMAQSVPEEAMAQSDPEEVMAQSDPEEAMAQPVPEEPSAQSDLEEARPQSDLEEARPQSDPEVARPQSDPEVARPQSVPEPSSAQSDPEPTSAHSNAEVARPQSDLEEVITQSDPEEAITQSDLEEAWAQSDPESTIMERLQLILTLNLKVKDLRSLTQPTRSLLQAGLVYAVHQVKGQHRYARISLEAGQLYLHVLKQQPPPLGAAILQMSEIVPPSPPCTVFLNLSKPGSVTQRVQIRLHPNTALGRHLLLLCTGQCGPSYCNTNLQGLVRKGERGESVIAGHYERKDETGAPMLLPDFDYGEYRMSGQLGDVCGLKVKVDGETRFRDWFYLITKEGRMSNKVFGKVVEGLPMVIEAAQHDNIKDVTVVDCGVAL